MSKPQSRHQRNTNDKEMKILRLWQSAMSPVDTFYAQTAEGAFKAIKWAISEKINFSASGDGRLASCDEKLYDYYKKLMRYYNSAVQLYNSKGAVLAPVHGHKSGDILNGIYSVVISRIKIFEENDALRPDEEIENNPVKIEKKMLISKSIRTFSENYDMSVYVCKSELYGECFFEIRKAFATMGGNSIYGIENGIYDRILTVIREKCCNRFYELYTESIKQAKQTLNDLFERHIASYYNEQLFNEQEILKNLATVQIAALESELADLEPEVKDSINAIISAILEAYQILSGDVSEIQNFLRTAMEDQSDSTHEELSEFSDSIIETCEKSFQTSAFEDARASFLEKLDILNSAIEGELFTSVKNWLCNGNYEKEALKEATILKDKVCLMTENIRNIFIKIYEYYDSDGRILQDNTDDGKISKGIAETIDIKVQSLIESLESFDKDIEDCSTEISGNHESFHSDMENLSKSVFSWLTSELSTYLKEDRRTISTVRKYLSFRSDNEIYSNYIDKFLKPISKYMDAVNKKIMRFKKEHLLYEISTFEEILSYSVSRLRESEIDYIKQFVEVIDMADRSIAEILYENGIEFIRPAPHDMFNGKEHEVLMAEKQENFKKGEIIKLMNSGFKQGDTIILRANVIASK